mmetsp:Transcript_288/g.534  ORF Transcript_288/g.534 Transcript_288/m.534 type:complete len:470 (-) Transcript_288:16-1425(-)
MERLAVKTTRGGSVAVSSNRGAGERRQDLRQLQKLRRKRQSRKQSRLCASLVLGIDARARARGRLELFKDKTKKRCLLCKCYQEGEQEGGKSREEEEEEPSPEREQDLVEIERLVKKIQQLQTLLQDNSSSSKVDVDRSALKKLRKSVDELQRELVRLELRKVVEDYSELEEELDDDFGSDLALESYTLNYVSVTFLTVAVAVAAWVVEMFLLGEDTSWWWTLPSSFEDAKLWLSIVSLPMLLAGLTQVKPLVSKAPGLECYFEQIFNHNDYMDSESQIISKYDREENLPLMTYLCFDVAIIGSELIVALGFFQGLLLKYGGSLGWTDDWSQFGEVPMGAIVNTEMLNAFTNGPLITLFVAGLISWIDIQLGQTESERYGELYGELKGELKGEKTKASDLANKLTSWQSKLQARKKYMWIEYVYWVYLTSEVYFSHSLLPSILTAVSVETFSWYRLWKESRKEKGEGKA